MIGINFDKFTIRETENGTRGEKEKGEIIFGTCKSTRVGAYGFRGLCARESIIDRSYYKIFSLQGVFSSD